MYNLCRRLDVFQSAQESVLNKLNFVKLQSFGLFKSKSNLAVNDYIPK